MSSRTTSVLFLFPGFDISHPVTGGERYESVMIQSAQADPRLVVKVAPYAGGLPPLLRQVPCLRRLWLQILCVLIVLFAAPDVLVLDASHHSLVLGSALVSRYLKRHTRLIVMHFHLRYLTSRRRDGVTLRIEQLSERLLYLTAHQIIAISQDGYDKLVQIGVASSRITIVRPAIDPVVPQFQGSRCSKEDGALKLLFVGQCYPRKGVEYLLRAMAKIKDAPVHLDLVGKYDPQSSYVRKLQEIITHNDLQERVSWAGFVSAGERARFYRDADIFVLPSLDEGYGIVLMEAMSYGLPIIASCVGAIPELVVDGETGLLVPAANPDELAAAISRLVAKPEERQRLGQRGYQRSLVLARTWEQVGAELVETLIEGGKTL